MKTLKSTISNISQNYRASCKSEQSITPLRVPFKQLIYLHFSGGSQQNCLSKKSHTSNNNILEFVLIEYKQLCAWVIREINLKIDHNQMISNINKQLFQFERFLAKNLDGYGQEIQALKLVHQEHQVAIQKLSSTNQDLKKKLKQISNNINEDFSTNTPLQKRHNYSIELITKQPLRNISYSLQEPNCDKENREIFPKKKSLKPKFKI
ncbi:unnamed protein product (macronuclear) [Paramecium tetraurelia]|uniref:Uncharacterized protein n=1 Tax=Paramecium tetraurelia TaxID=5888 RepID=A0BF17_PARTE|nr:uncharacterized protein GSPATT00028169001 [Paramecium tetraurelia]CAK57134.1 unnamed protein product [Paramecium tetraurelia]|eukprot:XP_001424532.1 hypothetical protein (macronuclear) [Paramecium tetraurelia strain d4-2]